MRNTADKFYSLKHSGYSHSLLVIILVLLVAVTGSVLLFTSRAATPTLSLEPEKGTVLGSAQRGNDSAASGGQYIAFSTPTPQPPTGVSAATPCVHAAAPTHWKHVVLLMFENKTASSVIGSSSAPWITSMAKACGSAGNWH